MPLDLVFGNSFHVAITNIERDILGLIFLSHLQRIADNCLIRAASFASEGSQQVTFCDPDMQTTSRKIMWASVNRIQITICLAVQEQISRGLCGTRSSSRSGVLQLIVTFGIVRTAWP
jgi:hypothetical protein